MNIDVTEKEARILALKKANKKTKRLNKILIEQRNKIKTYLETTKLSMVVLDAKATVVMVNNSFCLLSGYSKNELLGQNWFEKCLPQSEDTDLKYQLYLDRFISNTGVTDSLEEQILCKNGELKLIGWHNSYYKDKNGRITERLSSGEDITQKKEINEDLRRNKQKLELALASAHAGFWEWNQATNYFLVMNVF